MLKILYLCDKNSYKTKMSRVRFHGMRAIGKLCDLMWSGNGWENYDNSKTVQENIDLIYGEEQPDVVVAYKPLELKDFSEIKPVKCIRYNEMYDLEWTMREITESKSNLVVCHHKNDMQQYIDIFKNYKEHPIKFVNIPHCAEKIIYKDYGLPKEYDILLAGAVHTKSILGDHYPLRIRMARDILPKMAKKYKCKILQHPGGFLGDAASDRNSFFYAQQLNKAKICVTCSGKPRSRFGKYIEIPMSGTALAADVPGESQKAFKKFMIEIDMSMTDQQIIDRLSLFLDNDKRRQKLVAKGLDWSKNFTQERYAENFINHVEDYIKK